MAPVGCAPTNKAEKSPFCNSAFVGRVSWTTFFPGVPVLFPGKEKKVFVPAVVQLGIRTGTTQAAAKIVLVIRRPGRLKGRKVIVPRIASSACCGTGQRLYRGSRWFQTSLQSFRYRQKSCRIALKT